MRTAHLAARDAFAVRAAMPTSDEPIPALLARVELLTELFPLVTPDSPAAGRILDHLRATGRVLAELDEFGLLVGSYRTRYLAAIAAVTA
jgi:hypothetical protein